MTEPNFPPREAFRNSSIAEATLFIWINALIEKVDELEKRVATLEAHRIELEKRVNFNDWNFRIDD